MMSETYYPDRGDFTNFEAARNDPAALQLLVETLRGKHDVFWIAFPIAVTKASPAFKTFLQNPEKKGFVILDNIEFGRLREETFHAAKEKRVARPTPETEVTDDSPAHVGKIGDKKKPKCRKKRRSDGEEDVSCHHRPRRGDNDQTWKKLAHL
ncbi:MAG: hypothetical protein HYT94_03970 [Parcubacteria group bacterium]|nr:hypothetical protein [Parcubacteria group bacterium]